MVKYSKQRELIKQFVKEHNIHPTADDVYAMLKREHPNLSLGTVYRNLTVLSEHGDINRLRMANGSDRFDGQLFEHYHAVCSECGAVLDIELLELKKLNEKLSEITGMVNLTHQLLVNGVCEKCQRIHKQKEDTV